MHFNLSINHNNFINSTKRRSSPVIAQNDISLRSSKVQKKLRFEEQPVRIYTPPPSHQLRRLSAAEVSSLEYPKPYMHTSTQRSTKRRVAHFYWCKTSYIEPMKRRESTLNTRYPSGEGKSAKFTVLGCQGVK